MTDKKIAEQTAFETAGIPTPSDQENMASTDKINDIVKGVMDNIENAIFPESDRNQ